MVEIRFFFDVLAGMATVKSFQPPHKKNPPLSPPGHSRFLGHFSRSFFFLIESAGTGVFPPIKHRPFCFLLSSLVGVRLPGGCVHEPPSPPPDIATPNLALLARRGSPERLAELPWVLRTAQAGVGAAPQASGVVVLGV